jgi:hypothetical protein
MSDNPWRDAALRTDLVSGDADLSPEEWATRQGAAIAELIKDHSGRHAPREDHMTAPEQDGLRFDLAMKDVACLIDCSAVAYSVAQRLTEYSECQCYECCDVRRLIGAHLAEVATAHAAGVRKGLELAAKACEELAAVNRAEWRRHGVRDSDAVWAANECAEAIRALAVKGEP